LHETWSMMFWIATGWMAIIGITVAAHHAWRRLGGSYVPAGMMVTVTGDAKAFDYAG